MEKDIKYKDVPHFELIRKNGKLVIPSVFMFKGGCVELFSFLRACTAYNCEICFKNEEITIKPNERMEENLTLVMYMSLIESPKLANDYIRYLTNIDIMTWDKVI